MSKTPLSDELLREKITSYEACLLDALPREEDLDYVFSRRFERKMKKLLKQQKAKPAFSPFRGYAKMTAVVFASLLLALFVMTMSVDAYREKAYELVVRIFQDRTSLSFDVEEDAKNPVFTRRLPSYVPQGFSIREEDLGEAMVITSYENDEGLGIEYLQTLVGSTLEMDTEGTEFFEQEILWETVNYFSKDGKNSVFWSDENHLYLLSSSLSFDELFSMAKSIIKP